MKTTVDLPDDLVTELKVIAAREHRKLRVVMADLLSLELCVKNQPFHSDAAARSKAESWLAGWQDLGRRMEDRSADPRSGVEILLADR